MNRLRRNVTHSMNTDETRCLYVCDNFHETLKKQGKFGDAKLFKHTHTGEIIIYRLNCHKNNFSICLESYTQPDHFFS